jgi:site-specific recombinase XerD
MNALRTNPEMIAKLVDEVFHARNLMEGTRKNYRYHLARVYAQMRTGQEVREFHATAKEYLAEMERRDLTASTLIQARAAIRIAIDAIQDAENNYREWRPARRKTRRVSYEVLTVEEVGALQKAAATLLEEALIATALSTGLRRSELLNLKISDLNRDTMQIHVRKGKGCKDRVLPFPDALRETLIRYYRVTRPVDYLFCDPTTKARLTEAQLTSLWKNLKNRAGLHRAKGLHCLRHFFATQLLEAGINVMVLQQLLGHSHVQTTMIYLHATTQMTQSARHAMGQLLKQNCLIPTRQKQHSVVPHYVAN